jgi:ribosomal 50S subunit-recycling heat shock protein
MRKKRSIAKSRAASLKGWRTRERMRKGRKVKPGDEIDLHHPWGVDRVRIADSGMPTADDVPKVIVEITSSDVLTNPIYRRVLPNPWG